jgi:hypothetical protein
MAEAPVVFYAKDGTPFSSADSRAIYEATLAGTAATQAATTAAKAAADKAAQGVAAQAAQDAADRAAQTKKEQTSAYAILKSEFEKYGLGALVPDVETFIQQGYAPSEYAIALRNTKAYEDRFSANKERLKQGLAALSPAEYIALEDQYQNIMRNYGLPESYYAKDTMGTQAGFNKLLANDVSASELESRVVTAQKRVLNANPEVALALKSFYPDITNGDILAYSLDPKNGLDAINNKVTAAEIGGAAVRAGLTTNAADADYLRRYGVTKESADQGYTAIGGGLQRGSQLASIYGQTPYTQATAEQEVFNVPGAAEARKQRQKITGLEQATFGAKTGVSQGALARDRAGGY